MSLRDLYECYQIKLTVLHIQKLLERIFPRSSNWTSVWGTVWCFQCSHKLCASHLSIQTDLSLRHVWFPCDESIHSPLSSFKDSFGLYFTMHVYMPSWRCVRMSGAVCGQRPEVSESLELGFQQLWATQCGYRDPNSGPVQQQYMFCFVFF